MPFRITTFKDCQQTTRDTLLGGAWTLLPEFRTMTWPKYYCQSPANTSFDKSPTIDQAHTIHTPLPTSTAPLDNGLPPKSKSLQTTSVPHLHSFHYRTAHPLYHPGLSFSSNEDWLRCRRRQQHRSRHVLEAAPTHGRCAASGGSCSRTATCHGYSGARSLSADTIRKDCQQRRTAVLQTGCGCKIAMYQRTRQWRTAVP